MTEMTAEGQGASVSRANLALGASLLAFAIWVVAGAVSEDLFTLMPIPALAGVVLGLLARRDGCRALLVAWICPGLQHPPLTELERLSDLCHAAIR